MSRFPLVLFFACCLTPLVTGCKSKHREPLTNPVNILLITLDTTRADRLSLYGHHVATTPFLDAWARDALVFEDCVSTGSSTVPAHGSMFTGLLPSEHISL